MTTGPASGRPNIVIVVADSWRGDALGHAGNRGAVTPHLDDLVDSEAVSFTSAFCQGPVCTPSRCSFLSGRYPHVRGHRTQHHKLQADEPHFVRSLHESGYFVWWGGGGDQLDATAAHSWDVAHTKDASSPAREFGLDPHHDQRWRPAAGAPGYYSFMAGDLTPNLDDGRRYDNDWYHLDGAIDWLRGDRPDNRPYCLVLNLTLPHPPYAVEPQWSARIDPRALPPRIPTPDKKQLELKPAMMRGLVDRLDLGGFSAEQWEHLRTTYYGMCARVDHQVGLLLAALRDRDDYDNTALFFFSDHGDYTGDFGLVEKNQNTFEDPIARVPLIVKPPTSLVAVPGTRSALVELLDVSATVAEMAGLPADHTTFGQSLIPLLADPTAPGRDAAFCEGGRRHGERHCMELEANQDPEGLYYPRMSLQREEGAEHGKAIMCRTAEFKYVYRLYESDELYDLRTDPGELDNRILDPELADVRSGLRDRVLRHVVETADAVPIT